MNIGLRMHQPPRGIPGKQCCSLRPARAGGHGRETLPLRFCRVVSVKRICFVSLPLNCVKLLQIPKESVAKLRKTCYGLVQAPYEWYETVKEYLLSIGYTQLGSDPCAWVLKQKGKVHAVISGHVDDFMFVADPQDPIWLESKREIQNHFRWGEFEENRFTQCGVQIARQDDGGFHLSQERYMEHVKEIPMSQERRRDRKSPTTEHEKTILRGILGAMSWHCSQVGFRFFCLCFFVFVGSPYFYG